MARYQGTVTTPRPSEEVWRYLADLRSVAEWDPSVVDARLISGEPGTVGARYEVDVNFLHRTLTIPYVTVAAESPHRVAFSADTGSVSVHDEARIASSSAGGSTVTWDADLRLSGPGRMLDLPLRVAFNRIGSRAEFGLANRLNEPSMTALAGARA
jgi:carbon monoxide dehydrogenase subunit G